MQRLRRLAEKVASLNQDQIIEQAVDAEILDEVVRLNTDEQLFQGFDATGRPLSSIGGDYSQVTVQIKQLKGQPTDRVTLLDEGDFYNSFQAEKEPDGIQVNADYRKPGTDLRDRWGENLAGLTLESRSELHESLIPKVRAVLLRLNS